jgi:homoserine O-acetyltransferase
MVSIKDFVRVQRAQIDSLGISKLRAVMGDQVAAARAGIADANHFLNLAKANQLAAVDPANIKVPALVLYAPNDLIFYEPLVQETIQKIAAGGTPVENGTLPGPTGHLNGVLAIGQAADRVSAFLAR